MFNVISTIGLMRLIITNARIAIHLKIIGL